MIASMAVIFTLTAVVQAGDLDFTSDVEVELEGSGIDLVILSGSEADEIIIDSTTIYVDVGVGDTLNLQAPNNNRMENDGGYTACRTIGGTVRIEISGPDTVTFTPSADVCSSGGGSSSLPSSTGASTTPMISLSTPSSGSDLVAGSDVTISWVIGGAGISEVDLSYTQNGSETIIDTKLDDDADYDWTIPSSLIGDITLTAKGYDSGRAQLASDSVSLDIEEEGTDESIESDEQLEIERDDEDRRVAPSSGVFGVSPFDGGAEMISEVTAGQYIRGYNYDTVYYVTDDLTRRPFWDATTFMTWGNSWDDVIWVSDATLSTLPMSDPMLSRPGVVLIKIQSDPNVYWIEAGASEFETATLRWIPSEELAIRLAGSNWADYVLDIESTTFSRFIIGNEMTEVDIDAADTSMLRTRLDVANRVAGL